MYYVLKFPCQLGLEMFYFLLCNQLMGKHQCIYLYNVGSGIHWKKREYLNDLFYENLPLVSLLHNLSYTRKIFETIF